MNDDEKIIQALKCCKSDEGECSRCPYKNKSGCIKRLAGDSLDLIQRQQARINEAYYSSAAQFAAALENLTNNLPTIIQKVVEILPQATEQTIQKMIEEIEKQEGAKE